VYRVCKSSGLIVLLLSLLVVTQSFAGPVPADRMSVYFSREHGGLEEILVSLYGDVGKGGYIWVISSSLTHPAIAKALIDAKRRGVDVRLIGDKGKLETKRDEIAMYNLKLQGISIKVNSFPGAMRLEASIVDDKWVVVGSYNYGSAETRTPLGTRVDEEDLLVIPARVDKPILQQYKTAFERMWSDQNSYQPLK
jgi:phosphatidylserine/phosphatidylglycerophosphate/cardiolipin synthase-like enzyme